jgi:NapC/NirT cytochrome c family, N-terminal region
MRHRLRGFLGILLWSRIGLAGLLLTLVSGTVFLVLCLFGLLGLQTGPYFGILQFLLLPGIFSFGLILLPIGYLRARRWRHDVTESQAREETYPVVDLNNPRHRRNALIFVLLTLANLMILGLATYGGIEYTESSAFCGQVCHTVMRPEHTAFLRSPHARVGCVQCHIGSGAHSFLRYKLAGVRQLAEVALGTYSRPIPSPVRSLRPARETCEQCHWPDKHHGDRLRIIKRYDEDEISTERTTVMLVHVGGGAEGRNAAGGIHWHMNLANEITYIAADEKRLVIPWVRLRDREGRTTEFVASGATLTQDEIERAPKRVMDCVDCHNRPSHAFRAPEDAVDEAIASGALERRLPFVKRQALAALKSEYRSGAEASAQIRHALEAYYRENHPSALEGNRDALEAAIRTTGEIYAANVFPEMRVTWGTYPNNIGHQFYPGCFRCHDGDHRSGDGREIRQDCDICHSLLAVEEVDPPILKEMSAHN